MNDEQTLTILPGVYDGLGASIARHVGATAIYASGGAIARSLGLPDLGLVSMTEMASRLESIVRAFDGTVLADCSPTIRILDWRAASSPGMSAVRFASARRFAPVSSGSTPTGWCRPSRHSGATRTAATAANPAWRQSMTTRVPRRYG